MGRMPWAAPISFEERFAQYRTIADTEEAAHYLLQRWPSKGGRKYKRAQEVCIAVLEGKLSPGDARAAFMAAVEEANLYVMPTAKAGGRVEVI